MKDDPERVRAETSPRGPQEAGGEVIGYMVDCGSCGSTIMLTVEQHAVLLAV